MLTDPAHKPTKRVVQFGHKLQQLVICVGHVNHRSQRNEQIDLLFPLVVVC